MDVAEALDGEETEVGVAGVVDEGEARGDAFGCSGEGREARDRGARVGDGGDVVLIEIEGSGGECAVLAVLLDVGPGEGVVGLGRDAEGQGED